MMMLITVLSCPSVQQPVQDISVSNIFKTIARHHFDSGQARAQSTELPQPMKLISAGAGRTGTSSLKMALSRLGLKTYHMKDGVMDTPGHLDAWADYAATELQAQGANSQNVATILDLIAKDGFNATTDFPACLLYAEMLRRHPNARVVLSVRSSPEVWASSVRSTIGRTSDLTRRVPWRWVGFLQRFSSLQEWVWREFGLELGENDFEPLTGIPRHAALVRAYNSWLERVRTSVPNDQLLIFQPSDGWRPLCDFVSPVDVAVGATCEEVLASGEQYPYVNDAAVIGTVFDIAIAISYLAVASPILLLVIFCLAVLRRRRRAAAAATGRKTKTR